MPQPPETDVRIRVNDFDLSEWVSYQIESDVLNPSDAFSFTVENAGGRLSERVQKFDRIEVIVDGTVQMTGFVDTVNKNGSADSGSTLEVIGRDLMGQCLDVSAQPQTITGLDLGQIATKLAAPFVQFWRFENEVNRQKLLQARRIFDQANRANFEAERVLREKIIPLSKANFQDAPLAVRLDIAMKVTANYRANIKSSVTTDALKKAQANLAAIKRTVYPRVKVEAGQKIFEIIDALAKKQGFTVWMAANGDGVIAKPNYAQQPKYSVFLYPPDSPDAAKNNVLSWAITEDGTQQFSSYQIKGTGANTTEVYGEEARIEEQSSDSEVPFDRISIQTSTGQNKREAKAEVARDRDWRNFQAEKLMYRFDGHKQNGILWQVDTIAQVEDDVNNKHGHYYVASRRFTTDVNGGQVTDVVLYRPNIWLPQ